jgi:hypothetical protein
MQTLQTPPTRRGHNQFVDVSDFAQTPDGQKRRKINNPKLNLLNGDPSGRPEHRSEICRAKGNLCKFPQFCRASHGLVSYKE